MTILHNTDKKITYEYSIDSFSESLSDSAIIDLRILADRFNGDSEKVEKYAIKFVESITKGLVEMNDALLRQDMVMLKTIAHRIKSVAGTVGANGLSELCQKLDNCSAEELSTSATQRVKELYELFDIIVTHLSVMIPLTPIRL